METRRAEESGILFALSGSSVESEQADEGTSAIINHMALRAPPVAGRATESGSLRVEPKLSVSRARTNGITHPENESRRRWNDGTRLHHSAAIRTASGHSSAK